jgi:hypothetical protein
MCVLCCARVRVVFPVKQRGKPFEQGGDLRVVEQARCDEELAGPGGDEGGIALDDPGDGVVGIVEGADPVGSLDLLDHRTRRGSEGRLTQGVSELGRRSR